MNVTVSIAALQIKNKTKPENTLITIYKRMVKEIMMCENRPLHTFKETNKPLKHNTEGKIELDNCI